MNSCLYVGSVFHRRLKPTPHRFRYRLYWLLLDLDELDALDARMKLFSHNRPNVLSLHDCDHGRGDASPLRPQIAALLAECGINLGGGAIRLLCMPRTFGYGFNPLSVYYCADANGALAAMVYEVHNTFGERRAYVLPAATGGERQACAKDLFVSPFLPMGLVYEFHAPPPGETLTLAIRASGPDGTALMAGLKGERRELDDRTLLAAGLAMPAEAIKTIAAIHWEALRLWLKGAPYRGWRDASRRSRAARLNGVIPDGSAATDRESSNGGRRPLKSGSPVGPSARRG